VIALVITSIRPMLLPINSGNQIPGLARKLPSSQEKAIIEAALTECQGQVSGPSGAAAKLGIPGSTLESKIKSLKIDKNRFKSASFSLPASKNLLNFP
jgi:DNA-binding NtrC family response regulator